MKVILEQGVRDRFIENMNIYPEDYPTQESLGQGVYWTDECVSSLVTWVVNEFDNSDTEEKQDSTLIEWAMVCAQEMYDYLGLEDGEFDEFNNSIPEEKEDSTLLEWAMVCAQEMYDYLGLEDGEFDEFPNETWSSLIEQIEYELK